jgi:hypothetical protein
MLAYSPGIPAYLVARPSPWFPWSARPRHRLMIKESQFGIDDTEENKRKALEALESRGSRHDAATAADVSLKTLMDWRRHDDQFACANLGVLRSQHCCTSRITAQERALASAGCALKLWRRDRAASAACARSRAWRTTVSAGLSWSARSKSAIGPS